MLKKVPYISLIAILYCCSLISCTNNIASAPVYSLWHEPITASGNYTVTTHDTLYSIAWTYGLDYQHLAQLNQLAPPYTIHPGQLLRLKSTANTAGTAPTVNKTPPVKKPIELSTKPSSSSSHIITHWQWPARATVISKFSSSPSGNKGIDLKGTLGSPIYATAAGTVVYAGNGVRGYGNLIIIKHNNNYLSAYAYNQAINVSLNQTVTAGQKIATMGRNLSGNPRLHFEIRRNGQPINPLHYLTS